MKQYKNVGRHPEDLDGGAVVGPGEYVSADEKNTRVQRLVQEGTFLTIEAPKKTEKKESDL